MQSPPAPPRENIPLLAVVCDGSSCDGLGYAVSVQACCRTADGVFTWEEPETCWFLHPRADSSRAERHGILIALTVARRRADQASQCVVYSDSRTEVDRFNDHEQQLMDSKRALFPAGFSLQWLWRGDAVLSRVDFEANRRQRQEVLAHRPRQPALTLHAWNLGTMD